MDRHLRRLYTKLGDWQAIISMTARLLWHPLVHWRHSLWPFHWRAPSCDRGSHPSWDRAGSRTQEPQPRLRTWVQPSIPVKKSTSMRWVMEGECRDWVVPKNPLWVNCHKVIMNMLLNYTLCVLSLFLSLWPIWYGFRLTQWLVKSARTTAGPKERAGLMPHPVKLICKNKGGPDQYSVSTHNADIPHALTYCMCAPLTLSVAKKSTR